MKFEEQGVASQTHLVSQATSAAHNPDILMSAPDIPDISDKQLKPPSDQRERLKAVVWAVRPPAPACVFDIPDITASQPFFDSDPTLPGPRTIANRAGLIAIIAAGALLTALLLGVIAWIFRPVPSNVEGPPPIAAPFVSSDRQSSNARLDGRTTTNFPLVAPGNTPIPPRRSPWPAGP
jgi:hypothetical protein